MNTYNDIKGYKEEVQQLKALSGIMKDKEKYNKIKSDFSRGLLLIGPNGTGKTLMANAFIHDSGFNVVKVSNNDIESNNKFKKYIKNIFKQAMEKLPCIIFLDEADKLLGLSPFFYSEDSDTRFAAFLCEINEHIKDDGLFILMTANEKLQLEESLTRGGRIDKILRINKPNKAERKEIIEYYSKGNFEENIDTNYVSSLFEDMSAADIKSMISSALIYAMSEDRNKIAVKDIDKALYDKVYSSVDKDNTQNQKMLETLAVHEIGHAIVGYFYNKIPNIISILSRDKAKGFVHSIDLNDETKNFEDIKKETAIYLAGKASEEVILGNSSIGCSSDFMKARSLIVDSVRRNAVLGFEYSYSSEEGHMTGPIVSDSRLATIEAKEDAILKGIYNSALDIIRSNTKLVELIKDKLLKEKVISQKEFLTIVENYKKDETRPIFKIEDLWIAKTKLSEDDASVSSICCEFVENNKVQYATILTPESYNECISFIADTMTKFDLNHMPVQKGRRQAKVWECIPDYCDLEEYSPIAKEAFICIISYIKMLKSLKNNKRT